MEEVPTEKIPRRGVMAVFTCNGNMVLASDGREDMAHGTVDFPCACYVSRPAEASVPWHWHEELEFIYAYEGSLTYAVGGQELVMRAGEAAFANSGTPHAEWSDDPASLEYDIVCHPRLLYGSKASSLYTRYLGPLIDSSRIRGVSLWRDGAWREEAADCVRTAIDAVRMQEEFYEEIVRERLTHACLLIAKHQTELEKTAPAPPSGNERIELMCAYLKQHYAERVPMAALAAQAGISVRQAQREFREALGETPVAYLTTYRLQVAAGMLANTSESLAVVGASCGFQSPSYFSKMFRERYGCTPSQYRRQSHG